MTLTTKDSTDPVSPRKSAAPVPNPENKSAQTPRSNPVCLEVGVTIRSLPKESGGPLKPIREEGRTVIVFDNGAVLRSTSNLPAGQTVVLSNPSGREVICRIVGARNMPSVKGYVEVEFLESVEDYWHIHSQNEPTVAVAQPSAASAPSTAVSSGSGPSFDDIAGLVNAPLRPTTREQKIEPAKSGRDLRAQNEPVQPLREIGGSAAPSGAQLPISESWNAKAEIQAARETASGDPRSLVPSRDIMGSGLLASTESATSSSGLLSDGMPLRIAGAALLLAAIGGVMYFVQRGSTPVPAAQVAVPQQSPAAEPPAATQSKEPEPAVAAQAAPAQDASRAALAQPAVVAHGQPVPSIAPTPAAASSSVARDLPSAPRQGKGARDKGTNSDEASDPSSQAISNLKMKSPSAPKRNLAGAGEIPAPAAEIAPPAAAGGMPSAGLLSAVARSANQPAPPPGLSAVSRDAKLISSVHPAYPQTAKIANVQGSVVVLVSIDPKGNVVDAKAESGPMLLREAALDSVRKWKYSPALADGKPVSTQVVVTVDFKLTSN